MKETDIQAKVLEALTYHPRVAWIRRYNSATTPTARGGKYRHIPCVRAAKGIEFKQLDLMGQLKDGRVLAIEVKIETPKKDSHYEQQLLEIKSINDNGGLAFMANSAESAVQQLDAMLALRPGVFC